MIATKLPEPAGAMLVVAVACVAWLVFVSFLGGYLVVKEIGERLKN
jgi:hypothetical protein